MIYVKRCASVLSSRSFIVAGLTFKSLIYFKVIFVYGRVLFKTWLHGNKGLLWSEVDQRVLLEE